MADFRDKIHQGSEKRRQEWFANHTLPNHIRYISLGATLADPYEYLLKDDKLKKDSIIQSLETMTCKEVLAMILSELKARD